MKQKNTTTSILVQSSFRAVWLKQVSGVILSLTHSLLTFAGFVTVLYVANKYVLCCNMYGGIVILPPTNNYIWKQLIIKVRCYP